VNLAKTIEIIQGVSNQFLILNWIDPKNLFGQGESCFNQNKKHWNLSKMQFSLSKILVVLFMFTSFSTKSASPSNLTIERPRYLRSQVGNSECYQKCHMGCVNKTIACMDSAQCAGNPRGIRCTEICGEVNYACYGKCNSECKV